MENLEISSPDNSPELNTGVAPVQEDSTQTVTAPETASSPEVNTAGTESKIPTEEAFTPNWKFKVMDKEHEIPDWARAGIKTSEQEKAAKEAFEKAYGLDFVKTRYQETKTKAQEVEKNYSQLQQGMSAASQLYKKGDFEGLFKHFNIDEAKVLQFFLDKAKMMELPPEQKAAIQAQKEAEKMAEQARMQADQTLNSSQEQLAMVAGEMLKSELERPEVESFRKQFDARFGQDGAFIEEVIRRGDFYWEQQGKFVTPQKVVAEVMKLAGYSPEQMQQANQPLQTSSPGLTQTSNPAVVQVNRPQSSIPAISGKSSAPMPNKGPSSIEDIIELRKKKFGS